MNLQNKIKTHCYSVYRLFQNLPMKGQRTRANSGTPKHFNPYLSLKIDEKFYKERIVFFKKLEFRLNNREKQLRAFNENLAQEAKELKKTRKQKTKEKRQQFFKNQNFKK